MTSDSPAKIIAVCDAVVEDWGGKTCEFVNQCEGVECADGAHCETTSDTTSECVNSKDFTMHK